jgi:single-stranded-DNA-specific exonuclease
MNNEYIWKYEAVDENEVTSLQNTLKINRGLCEVLIKRNIKTFEEAKNFFRPQWSHLHNPFLMKDMDKAVKRITTAMEKEEKILVYGDYDVDGTTSVSLVYSYLQKIYKNIGYYFPDRQKEGYGISITGIDYAHDNDFSLVIALDCGIKDVEKMQYALSKKVDFIICDHHQPGEEVPNVAAILNPKQVDCNYPYKELSGCGIGYKLMDALGKELSIPQEEIRNLIDLTAISIAADIVPITDENRTLAYFGLEKINKNPLPGIKQLIEISGIQTALSITDVVFVLAPRINAAGRLAHASEVAKLLVEQDPMAARDIAIHLNNQNLLRKDLDAEITLEALSIINEDSSFISKNTTVVYQPHWHKGVIGIVASRLIENRYRPTIVFTKSEDKLVGSARSVKDFDVYSAILACKEHYIQFGGHKYAAGITLHENQLEGFIQTFEEVVSQTIEPHHLIPKITIDAELTPEHFTEKIADIIEQMSPFGPGNMRPNFVLKDVLDTGYSRIVKEKHIKFEVYKKGYERRKLRGIGFNLFEKMDLITSGKPFDICFQLALNEWNGSRNIEMKVKDIRASL